MPEARTPRRRRTTLADVAARAGVSRATASRALAGDLRISRPTRKAVIAAAALLAYVPNQTARSLRTRRTRSLGLLLSDLADPDHAQVGAGFEQYATEAGYSVLVVATRKRSDDEERAVRVLHERGTDGICIASSSLDPTEIRHAVAPTPLVVVQPDHARLMEDLCRLPAGVIRSDDVAGVGQAVRHLLMRGYRDIAYLGVGPTPTNRLRMATAEQVLRAQIDRPIREFEVGDEDWRAPERVAGALGDVLPEAVLCYDDKLAISLLDGLRSRGVRVPEDVAVVGYDGIPFAAFSSPRLTTVAVPSVEMGTIAARTLVSAIEAGELSEVPSLPAELVVRESSGRSTERGSRPLLAGAENPPEPA